MKILGFDISIRFRRKWPLIHKGKRILDRGGSEALSSWIESLSDQERNRLKNEYINLMASAFDIALASVIRDLQEGKIKL